ncbi:MAG TPA: hypothetical protein VFI40_04785 [Nocardioides sp.]|nr:hypothetical protein [Nocardioides sp.]
MCSAADDPTNYMRCAACGETLIVEGDGDGTGAPVHLFCDYCPKVEHAADLTPDWNGETGNHLSCEADAPWRHAGAAFVLTVTTTDDDRDSASEFLRRWLDEAEGIHSFQFLPLVPFDLD